MRRLLTIFKNSLRTIYGIVAVVFVFLYVSAHYNLNGYLAKKVLSEDIASYLGTEVSVGNAEVDIFNQIVLEQLLVKDQNSDTLLSARRVMLSFDIIPLLKRKLEIHTIQLVDFDVKLSRQDSESDPNYKFLVDIFAPKDDNKNALNIINVNSVILRSGSISYDDFSKAKRTKYFDKNHIRLLDISSNLKIKSTKEEGFYAKLKRLSFDEVSGLKVTKATADISFDNNKNLLKIDDVQLQFEQLLEKRFKAFADVKGNMILDNKILDVEDLVVIVSSPDRFDIKAIASIKDALSSEGEASINADLEILHLTNAGLNTVTDLFISSDKKETFKKYIDKVGQLESSGQAEGSLSDFSYKLSTSAFGEMSAEINVDGAFTKEQPINCNIDAVINNLDLLKHEYEHITVNGDLVADRFDGIVDIKDPSCDVSAKGFVNFGAGSRTADLTADINNISPYSLHLTNLNNFEGIDFSGEILASDIQFNRIKSPIGTLSIKSLSLANDNDTVTIDNINVKAERQNNLYKVIADSPIFSLNYEEEKESSSLQGVLMEERSLSEILKLPVSVVKDANFRVELDSLRRLQYADVHVPEVLYNGNPLKFDLSTYGEADSLNHILQFDYKMGGNELSSVLYATSRFSPLYLDIKPCKLSVNKDIMDCGGATIEQLNSKTYDLRKFSLSHEEQSVKANGLFSTEGESDLSIHIEEFKLDTIFGFLNNKYLNFGGIGTGDILYSSDSIRHVETKNLFVKDFSYMNGVLGDTKLQAYYDLGTRRIDVDADVLSEEDSHSYIDGYIKLGKIDSLDLNINADKLQIQFLDYWLKGFLQNVKGDLTGDVHLFGPARRLNLLGNPYVDASFTNNLVGANFNLKDNILLTTEGSLENGLFALNDAKVFDSFGHQASVNANIKHKHLLQYVYDVKIDLPNDNNGFLLFDKQTHFNNELYWGQLYTSGTLLLKGGNSRHRVEVSCKTVGKSQFYLSPGEESYSDNGYSFLTFRDKEQFLASENFDYSDNQFIFINKDDTNDSPTYIECDIQAQATENCQVYVQMDPLAEDRLICRGNGNISLHYDPRHDITIGGEYNITSGNYLITMRGDLMNKEFQIQNGSRVSFPGNFSNAELNIDAIYSIPSVNLRDLDESFATMASMNRTTLPVDCKLAVTGQLSAPQIAFDLDVKNTSDDVQALVHNLIGTQEMLNREVFYLLLFSKFYTPEYATASQNNAGSQLSSFASSSLTSQLNNLLGHVSDNFTLGTNFRSDKGDFTDMEMDVSLSTRLWGDRLILNGNLGYRDPANRVGMNNNATSFIGDFDVEFLINTSGTLRAKAYSHYNERDYSINNALTTQGIGFIVRKDFKSVKELLFWKKFNEKK